jgi:hypothetical protein
MSAPTSPDEKEIRVTVITWRGISIELTEEIDWLGLRKHCPDWEKTKLEIRIINPLPHPLPITETGFQIRYMHPATFEEAGGLEAFVLAWLDHAAQSPEWKKIADKACQLSLF